MPPHYMPPHNVIPHNIKVYSNDAEYFNLFDNIEYKYLKNIVKEDAPIDIEIGVEDINERNQEGIEIMRASFTFDLGSTKIWTIQSNFTWTSLYGRRLYCVLTHQFPEDEDEDYETEEEEIYSEPSSP